LILSNANGGKVIGTIGNYVVGGNYVIGLIVFLILVVIQYVVVTNGAQRVAEVAARFTLDSMPGQQMSIDADLNMGFIDQAEAQRRRKNIEKEANFYGAMDGASKFVKGDAIAGIIILLVDMLGGWAIGVVQQGMKWDEALHTFTLLTIGDGIVTQVPALVIALGTGIIVTRSGSDEHLSIEVLKQLTSFPKTLFMVIAALMIMIFLPGMPALPLAFLIILFSTVAYFSYKSKSGASKTSSESEKKNTDQSEDIYDLLTVEPIEIKVGQNLVSLINSDDALLMERISSFRKSYALEAGFIIPKIRIRDDKKMAPNAYEIMMYGVQAAQGELVTDRILAIHPDGDVRRVQGVETKDPSYGLPALWILETQRSEARTAGYTLVDPVTVFITHLNEVIRQNSASLLSRMETERLINNFRKNNSGLVEELIPTVLTLSEVQKILQNLLKEKISIRNLELILEVLVDCGKQNKDPEYLTELVRQKLGAIICQSLTNRSGDMSVLTLDPAIEQTIANCLRAINEKPTLVLEPQFAEQLLSKTAGQVERMIKNNVKPVLLCAPELRRHLRRLTERLMPQLAIVSMSEIPSTINLRAFGVVTV
jgi:flagellar biosynthesis protein FlhA